MIRSITRTLPFFILLKFSFLLPALSFGQTNSITPTTGDAIVVGSIGDARNLIPILASDSASGTVASLIFNGLVKYDRDLKLVGDLAEKWIISEDGLKITFFLRKNVRWHDGEPFTAKDVIFTYKKLVDPKVKTPYSGDFEKIESIKALDKYTVQVVYKEPFSPGLASWGMGIIPEHILKNQDLNKTDFSRNPIGTGPYKFSSWKTGEKIELVYNPDYFEGRPFIDRYIYRIIPDMATMFLELRTLGVDVMQLTPLQYKKQTSGPFFIRNFQKFRYPSFGYTYMGYNLKDWKFKDKLVRQAINYAVDKEEIIKGVLLGLGRVCTGPFVPESWAYNKNVKPVEYNPVKAREMLKKAGWKDTDGDGWLDKDGKRFEFTIITNQGNRRRKMTAEIIQRRLSQVGIKVKIRVIEWSVFIGEFINKRRFEAVLLGWGLSREPDPFDIWHSSKTKEGEFNFISYQNKEVDRLIERARRTFDIKERARLYHKIHQVLYEEQPYLFLYVPDALPIIHSRFKGIQPAPAGIFYNFIKWWVPRAKQRYVR